MQTKENTKLIGLFQHFTHPEYAECLNGSEYIRTTTTLSRYIPGKIIDGAKYFICPKCEKEHIYPEHGNAYQCTACNLKWQMYGYGLYIWE